MHSLQKAQIAYLKADETPSEIFNKYTNLANIFSSMLAIKLSEHISINNYAIKLIDDWQPLYGSIYNLGPVKWESFKVYINNNLANGFIWSF